MHRAIAAALLGLFLPGCAVVQLPLCSRIANLGGGKDHVNRYIRARAAERSIGITELSPYVAEYRGAIFSMPRFVANYRHMLCAFDPGSTTMPESRFHSCMHHAPVWMDAVRGGDVEMLLRQGEFTSNCIDPLGEG